MTTQLVRDWMTKDPVVVGPKATLPDIHGMMKKHKCRRVPVVEDGKLVGIVSLKDVLEAEPSDATTLSIYELNYMLAFITADKLMTRNVVTVTPTTPIREVAGIMLQHKIGGVPVTEGGEVVGIITESDIFRMLVRTA